MGVRLVGVRVMDDGGICLVAGCMGLAVALELSYSTSIVAVSMVLRSLRSRLCPLRITSSSTSIVAVSPILRSLRSLLDVGNNWILSDGMKFIVEQKKEQTQFPRSGLVERGEGGRPRHWLVEGGLNTRAGREGSTSIHGVKHSGGRRCGVVFNTDGA